MKQKDAFFRFIQGNECSAQDFNLAVCYFKGASFEEKELFFQKQKEIFLECIKEMKKRNTDDYEQVKDVYQKFGMSDLYFGHIFHFFNHKKAKAKESDSSLRLLNDQERIFEEAKGSLWDSKALYKIARKYHITPALLDDLLSGYAKEHYGVDKEKFQDFKIYYRNFRKVITMQKVSRFQRRQAYLYYQTYALPDEKDEFEYLVQNILVKITSIIDLKEATDAFLKENCLTDYDLYFYSTVQSLSVDIKRKLFQRFQIYYDICVKYNFSSEVNKEVAKYGITSKEFIQLAKVYAKEVLKIDNLKKEHQIIYTKPICTILDSLKDEEDFYKIIDVLSHYPIQMQDISVFCYCVNASLAKEEQQALERKFLTCLNVIHKRRIDEGHKKSNQPVGDYTRYYEYLNQDLNFIDFCNAQGIDFRSFRNACRNLKNSPLSQMLRERIEKETEKETNIKVSWCKELVQSIQNGIIVNGVHRKFNLFDYFYYYGEYQIHKYFISKLSLPQQEKTILNRFFQPLKRVNYINSDVFLNSHYYFHVHYDDRGQIIEGTGTVLAREDLQNILDIFNEHQIPLYDILVNIATRCYADHALVQEMTLQRK